jgi:hypothetical protein
MEEMKKRLLLVLSAALVFAGLVIVNPQTASASGHCHIYTSVYSHIGDNYNVANKDSFGHPLEIVPGTTCNDINIGHSNSCGLFTTMIWVPKATEPIVRGQVFICDSWQVAARGPFPDHSRFVIEAYSTQYPNSLMKYQVKV